MTIVKESKGLHRTSLKNKAKYEGSKAKESYKKDQEPC